jgi:serine/threonine protein kinase
VDNIFVGRDGYVKLGDYGFAKELGTPYRKYTYNVCTIEYRAPELFFGSHYYGLKCDIWSVGCLIAFIFTGKHLFQIDGQLPDIEVLSQIFYLFGTFTVLLPSFRRKCGPTS